MLLVISILTMVVPYYRRPREECNAKFVWPLFPHPDHGQLLSHAPSSAQHQLMRAFEPCDICPIFFHSYKRKVCGGNSFTSMQCKTSRDSLWSDVHCFNVTWHNHKSQFFARSVLRFSCKKYFQPSRTQVFSPLMWRSHFTNPFSQLANLNLFQ